MKDYILNYMIEQEALGIEQLLLNMIVALGIGMLIYASYRLAYTDVTYSRRFNASLVMMALITTIVMTVISNNVALSLGMVGALSIVRFRTAIKDPRDTVFIFWTIAIGICCGVSQYMVAAVGSAFVFLFLLIFGHIRTDGRYLLVIRCNTHGENEVESIVFRFYQNIHLRVKNTTRDETEYIYELSERVLKAKRKREGELNLEKKLYAIKDVITVNLIEQNDEISR